MEAKMYHGECWFTASNHKFNRNSDIFFQENASEIVVWKMSTILCWPQFVKESMMYNVEVYRLALYTIPGYITVTSSKLMKQGNYWAEKSYIINKNKTKQVCAWRY